MSEERTLEEFANAESEESNRDELARKTVCGIPPSDWPVARLGEVARVVSGNSLPTEYQDDTDGEHPVYKVSDMNEPGNHKYVSTAKNCLTEVELSELNHTLYPAKTTILPKVGAALLTNKRRMLTEPSSFDNNVMGLVPEQIHPEFLFCVSCMVDMEAFAQKGAVPSISKSIAQSLKVPFPPSEEQRKIASVLYNIDQVIQQTTAILQKLETIEKGAIQSLLSHGVRANTNTKETSIGNIPEHWRVVQLGDITNVTVGYVQNIADSFTDASSGVRIFRTKDISARGLDAQENAYVTRVFHEDNRGSQLSAGDLIVARHGDSGQAAVIPESIPEAHCQNVVIVRSSEDFVSKFIEYLFNYEVTRQRLLAWKAGSVQKVVSTTAVQNFRIPLPPIDEQGEIVDRLSEVSERLEIEESFSDSLATLKRGLMQDLLSGEVRTTNADIEVLNEVLAYG